MISATVTLAACAPAAAPAAGDDKHRQRFLEAVGDLEPLDPPAQVLVAEDGSPSGAGFYIAQARGYFAALGIEIEFVDFASSADMLPAVAAGHVDLAGGISSVALFNAVARGLDVRIVADKGTNIPGRSYFRLVVRPEAAPEIQTYADMKGRRIAVASVGTINEYTVARALAEAGLNTADVDLVVIDSFGDMNAALANGAVDMAMHIEPLMTMGEENGILQRWHDTTRFAPDMQVAVTLASPQLVSERAEVGRRFMTAYLFALRDYHRAFVDGVDLDGIIAIMAEYTALDDPDLWRKVHVTGLNPNGRVSVDSLAHQLAWYRERGLFDAEVDLETVVDHRLVEFALEVLGPYDD